LTSPPKIKRTVGHDFLSRPTRPGIVASVNDRGAYVKQQQALIPSQLSLIGSHIGASARKLEAFASAQSAQSAQFTQKEESLEVKRVATSAPAQGTTRTCNICAAVFLSKSALRQHRKATHLNPDRMHDCYRCTPRMKFKCRGALRQHNKMKHPKPIRKKVVKESTERETQLEPQQKPQLWTSAAAANKSSGLYFIL
jgi:hypothetical protein